MKTKTRYIQSALNYTGSKYKLLPQLIPLFPNQNQYTNFIDLFAGGGSIGINIQTENKIYFNDLEKHVIKFFQLLNKISIDDLLININNIIDTYKLSKTTLNGYEYYDTNSSKGVGVYNKENYTRLRKHYNEGKFSGDEKIIVFYLLTVYSFNNQIRFNSKGEFNLPTGKRDFNRSRKRKLKLFHEEINKKEIIFTNKDFRNFHNIYNNDFIYADPPYRIATASYNENGNWTKKDDLDLFEYLDAVDKSGAKFALSNVRVHNGEKNEELINWAEKYDIKELNFNYNNSNYQTKAQSGITEEVLIINY